MKILENIGITFDDVLLVPQKSSISSRFSGEIDLSIKFVPGIELKYGIISSNMDSITEASMANKMYELGGLGIIHRFLTVDRHIELLNKINGPKVLCIGVGKEEFARFQTISNKINLSAVLIDIAHGHSEVMLKQIKRIQEVSKIPIIAGNIATYNGTLELLNAGACSIKCGVGNGSVCTTRIQTGCGVPLLTSLIEARRAIEDYCEENEPEFKPTLICDGGVRNSGDIIKAYAAGADVVMTGSLFAATDETPGELIKSNGKVVKVYRGMASRAAQENWKGFATSIEGEMTYLPYKGPLGLIFNELIAGMLSGMSYQDALNIKQLRENAEFIRMTLAGYKESLPHGIV